MSQKCPIVLEVMEFLKRLDPPRVNLALVVTLILAHFGGFAEEKILLESIQRTDLV